MSLNLIIFWEFYAKKNGAKYAAKITSVSGIAAIEQLMIAFLRKSLKNIAMYALGKWNINRAGK